MNSKSPSLEGQKSSLKEPGQLILGPSTWPEVVTVIPEAQTSGRQVHLSCPEPQTYGCGVEFATVKFLVCLKMVVDGLRSWPWVGTSDKRQRKKGKEDLRGWYGWWHHRLTDMNVSKPGRQQWQGSLACLQSMGLPRVKHNFSNWTTTKRTLKRESASEWWEPELLIIRGLSIPICYWVPN